MSFECKNCKANPVHDPTVILRRINPKGVIGEWICDMCPKSMETFEDKPHYVHSPVTFTPQPLITNIMKISVQPPYKNYTVTMRFQFPAWDERDGISYDEQARSKSDAVKHARRQAERDGHLCGGKGRVAFKAQEVS